MLHYQPRNTSIEKLDLGYGLSGSKMSIFDCRFRARWTSKWEFWRCCQNLMSKFLMIHWKVLPIEIEEDAIFNFVYCNTLVRLRITNKKDQNHQAVSLHIYTLSSFPISSSKNTLSVTITPRLNSSNLLHNRIPPLSAPR